MDLGRSHADDFAIDAVQHHGAAHDIGITAKLLLPEAVAQNNDAVLAGGLFGGRKETPQGGPYPEGLKQVGADGAAEAAARGAAAGDVVFGVERIA